MKETNITRRGFIRRLGASATLLPYAARAAIAPASKDWVIGCFNRPWAKWGFDVTLDGLKAAGYEWTGLLGQSKNEPFIGSGATAEYLASVKEKIAARGLKANMGTLQVNYAVTLREAIADVRKQLSNAHSLGLRFAMSFGVSKSEQYEQYYKIMADAAAFGQERRIEIVLKPHGGGNGAAEEILRCMKQVGHSNFKVWYDAGNIIHYTGKDPVAELEPIAKHVTGFCAKDCGAVKGPVMIQFGAGKVDFVGVLRRLRSAGFNGPIMVEGCAVGESAEATTENARANRLFLERLLARI